MHAYLRCRTQDNDVLDSLEEDTGLRPSNADGTNGLILSTILDGHVAAEEKRQNQSNHAIAVTAGDPSPCSHACPLNPSRPHLLSYLQMKSELLTDAHARLIEGNSPQKHMAWTRARGHQVDTSSRDEYRKQDCIMTN